MIRYENDCCDCGLPCTGAHTSVPHYYCDDCGNEFNMETLYDMEDGQLCLDCAVNHLSDVDLEDAVRLIYKTLAEVG